MEVSNGFHALLAQLSGSRVLVLLLRAISHIVIEHVALGLDPLEEWQVIEDDHAAIAQCDLRRASRAGAPADERPHPEHPGQLRGPLGRAHAGPGRVALDDMEERT